MKKFFTNLKKTYSLFFLCLFLTCNAEVSWGQVSLTVSGTAYTQNFTSFTATNAASLPSGWSATFTGTSNYAGYGTGSSTTGGIWSYGVDATGANTERALGALRTGGAGNIAFTVSFTNNIGSTITSLNISYNFEQWRYANTSGFAVTQTNIGSSVSGLDQNGVASGTNGTVASTAKSLNLTGLNIANGTTFTIVWTTTDVTGADNGIAIDDFSLTPTTTATGTSDIIANGSFTAPTNIAYASFQSANITDANSVEVAQFTIRDGGASAPDANSTTTTLTDITFSLSNSSNIRRVALYDGASEILEVAGGATVPFSGIGSALIAPDNGTKTFSIRVTFNAAVTDNQQFQFAITAATATGSTFAVANAGGAVSSITGDNNRIEVTSDRLIFTTQPSNTTVNATMTSPVVQARDALGNTDADYTTTVSITSTGTLNSTPKTATPTSGVATFTTIIHTATGTGLTLTASSGSLTSAVSNTFNIVSFSYCTPAPSSVDGNGITNVLMGTINNTTGAEVGNYGNYSAQSTNVVQGATQSCAITYQTGFTYNTKIWIDLNNDGDFGDTGEEVYTGTSTNANPTTLSASFVIPIATPVGSYRLRIGGADTATPIPCYTGTFASYEDYTINVIAPCTPTHTITSFLPTSGPIATLVTITGTGFTAGSTVRFGGIAATSTTFVSSTQIIAEVPAGFTTENIRVTESSCEVISASTFIRLELSGTCATAMSDLIISEVYDATSGSLGYVEIYNGTAATIDLTNYEIRRFADIGDGTPSHTYTFPTSGVGASINSGQLLVGKISTDADTYTANFSFGNPIGFNEDDRLELWNTVTNTKIDMVNSISVDAGYSYRRNTTVTGPNTTFTASEWTFVDTESTTNLGTFVSGSTTPTITTNPTDIIGCSFNMTASGASLTYQWYFNDPTSMTGWSTVTTANLTTANALNSAVVVSGATTTSLSLTGNLTNIFNYQFYCQATSGTCNRASNAAQYTYQSRPIYRSVAAANGNWSNNTNWEMANTTAGPWVSTCSYPTDDNSSEVIIQNGTTIILDIDNILDKITVESGGTLEVGTNSQLTMLNSVTGADLILNGTFIYRSNSANNIAFNGGATWQLGSSANLIKTNTGNATNLRDNYETGIANIPASANWIYRYNGDGNISVVTVGMFYPNLTIESTSGFWDATTATSKFDGSTGGFATVKGNLDIGGTGSGTVTIYNENTNASPMLILGNAEIRAGNTLTTNNVGRGFELSNGNLTVNGTLNATGGTGLGIVRFSSTTAEQTISGTTGAVNIANLEVNKSSSFDLKLLRSINITLSATLNTGDINLNGFNIDMGTTAMLSETLPNHVVKDFTATTEASQGGYVRFTNRTVDATQTNIGGSRVLLNRTTGSDYNVNIDRYHYKGDYGKGIKLIYKIDVNSGTMGTTNIRINYTDDEAFAMLEPLDVARWRSATGWANFTATSKNSVTNFSQLDGITAFSHWTLFDTNVPLASATISAVQVGKSESLISWSGGEVGKKILQKSLDGLNFYDLAYPENNDYTDLKFNENAYYRLKAQNKNTFSPIVFLKKQDSQILNLYPNPYSGGQARLSIPENTKIEQMTLLDLHGRNIAKITISNLSEQLEALPKGVYILQVQTDKILHNLRFVKQ